MKRTLQDTFFLLVFIILLGFFLYYIYYKPVEGFFAKEDACAVARADKTTIDNEINSFTSNYNAILPTLSGAIGARSEIQAVLTSNNCTPNSTQFLCQELNRQLNLLNETLTNAQNDISQYTEYLNTKRQNSTNLDSLITNSC